MPERRFGLEALLAADLGFGGAAALVVAERLRNAIAEHPMTLHGGGTIHVTASFGVAELFASFNTLTAWLERADTMLYATKAGISIGVDDMVLFLPDSAIEVDVRGDVFLIVRERDVHAVASSERDVGPGDVVRIEPGQSQRITNTGKERLTFLAICTPRFQPSCYEPIVQE